MSQWRMLVVEDDPGIQSLLEHLFEPYSITVECASTPEDALALVHSSHYDAAIIDLVLPGMDGCDLLQSIRLAQPDLPCIAVTAFHSPERVLETVNAGFNGYFPKPLQTLSFARSVRNFLH
jgi:two-component system, OmpR family, response regulator